MFASIFVPVWICEVSIGAARVYVETGKDGNFSKKKGHRLLDDLWTLKNQRDC
jgi:hypothetical protein